MCGSTAASHSPVRCSSAVSSLTPASTSRRTSCSSPSRVQPLDGPQHLVRSIARSSARWIASSKHLRSIIVPSVTGSDDVPRGVVARPVRVDEAGQALQRRVGLHRGEQVADELGLQRRFAAGDGDAAEERGRPTDLGEHVVDRTLVAGPFMALSREDRWNTGIVCGLWQATQSKLQPCRNTTNRLPGPSTLLNVMVSATTRCGRSRWSLPVVSLDGALVAADALHGALREVERVLRAGGEVGRCCGARLRARRWRRGRSCARGSR